MSALDFTARALAMRAVAQAPLTFVELAEARLPIAAARVDTSGHAVPGKGAGTYISDALANAALMAQHPGAAFEGTGNRIFRLAGDAQGYVTPEQLGCPAYSPGVNQQPYLQAAIRYAEAVGLNGVLLTQARYELWAPLRTGGGEGYSDNNNHSGNFLVIAGRVSLVSTHPLRTTLHCKGPTGGSLADDYQVFDDTIYGDGLVWRGAGIKLTSTVAPGATAAEKENLSMVRLENLILLSDAVGKRDTTWPARVADANCWDVTNKGICFQQDKQHGLVRAANIDIIGFLGECIYTAGSYSNKTKRTGFIGRNLVCKNSNAQALNPNGPHVFDIDGLYVENCSFTIEGWAGWEYGRIVNAYFRNCKSGGLSGGNIHMAALRPDESQPLCYIDMVMDNCGDFYAGSMLQGRLRLIDTRLALVENGSTTPIKNVDLDVTMMAHNVSLSPAVRIAAHAQAPAESIENVVVRLTIGRTTNALTKGHLFNALISESGSIGRNCVLYTRGNWGGVMHAGMTPSAWRVAVIDEGMDLSSSTAPTAFNATTTPSPEVGNAWLRATFGGSSAQWPMNLPSTAQFNEGHEVTVVHRDAASPNATLLIDGRALLGLGDRARFRCNKANSRWDLVERPTPRKVSALVAITSTARGAESGPYAIAVSGCRPHFRAEVLPPPSGIPGFVVSGVRAETDQVKFWVRNVDGADPDAPAPVTFTASCSVPV